jgi:hypothetical protein
VRRRDESNAAPFCLPPRCLLRLRTPLLVLLAAALAGVVVPAAAGAAQTKDWIRQEFPCRDGKKVAVFGYSPTHPLWLVQTNADGDDEAVQNPKAWASWYKNPCKGQWLQVNVWHGDFSEGSNTTYSIAPGRSGHLLGGNSAGLNDGPDCGGSTWDIAFIATPKQIQRACPDN